MKADADFLGELQIINLHVTEAATDGLVCTVCSKTHFPRLFTGAGPRGSSLLFYLARAFRILFM